MSAATTPTSECCAECRYLATDRDSVRKLGVCRRYPPAAGVDPKLRFSIVSLSDWCGEYAAAAHRGTH